MNIEAVEVMGNEGKINKKSEVIGIAVTYLVMLLITIFLDYFFYMLLNTGMNIPTVVYGTIIEIGIVIPAIIYTKIKGESIVKSFGFKKIRFKTFLLTLVLTFLSLPPYWCANALSQVFVPNTMIESASKLTSGSILGSFFVMAIAASLCGEMALRGLCFKRLKGITSLLAAAVISAIMFGVLHLNINQMCYAIVLGFIFALADHASGSIWPSIIMHTIINSIGFIYLLLIELITESADLDLAEAAEISRTQDNTMLITGVVLLVISIGFSFLIRKVLKKMAVSEEQSEAA